MGFFSASVPQISLEEVKKSIETKDGAILLDVRTPEECPKGKLEGSINVPVDEITQKISSVIPDTSSRVYVYCLSGNRSQRAVQTMVNMGYTNVYDVPHGMLAWRIKKYPVV